MVRFTSSDGHNNKHDVTRVMRQHTAMWAVCVALLVGGYFVTPIHPSLPPGGEGDDAFILESLSRLSSQLSLMEGEIQRRGATGQDRKLLASSTSQDTIESLFERLSVVLDGLPSASVGREIEDIRVARRQQPHPNMAEIALLREALDMDDAAVASGGPAGPKTERSWWLLGKADVIRRLGTPSNLMYGHRDVRRERWEYWDQEGDVLITVVFSDGLVIDVVN